MKRTKLITFLTLLFLLVPASIAFADETVDDDDVIDNDVTIFGEDLHIEAGGIVNGDVVIFDGDLELDGTVNGDVVIFGEGGIEFGETGQINGDCISFSSKEVGESADIFCHAIPVGRFVDDITAAIPNLEFTFSEIEDEIQEALKEEIGDSGLEFTPDADFEVPSVPEVEVRPPDAPKIYVEREPGFFAQAFGAVGQSIVFGLLAMLLASVFPQNLERMSTAVRQKPVAMGVVGVLTSIAVPSLMVILAILTAILIFVCIGLLGIPILLAMGLGLAAGLFVGWAIVGSMVGEWLTERLNVKGRSHAFTVGFGTAVLTLGLGLIGAIISFPEAIAGFAIGMVGLGSAALTQFGRKSYPRNSEPPVDDGKIDIVLQTLPDDLK